MTWTHTMAGGLAAAVLLVTAGCATGESHARQEASASTRPRTVTQREAADLTFQYRRLAAEYREAARRLELEAQVFARQSGGMSELSQRRLDEAGALRAAADEAEELARQYRRQTPHGQVY